ncbi:hypothetical protein HDV05_007066 [Chytridiales sp. JEL 0842]|nr:hypothetical protein HDV05_007066 [Chytridiales sp. JEL 0842]
MTYLTLCSELWERIFIYTPDPLELLLTCKSIFNISRSPTNRIKWIQTHHHPNILKIFHVSSCFSPFDSLELENLESVLDALPMPSYSLDADQEALQTPVPASVMAAVSVSVDTKHDFQDTTSHHPGHSPRSTRLFRLLSDHDCLLKMVEMCSWDRKLVSKSMGLHPEMSALNSTALQRPSRALRRLARFIAYLGHRQALLSMLSNCPTLSGHPRELSVMTAFAIHSKSVDCLLPLLALKPSLERNDHLAFCEAIRTDQTYIAELLIDYYYKARADWRSMQHAALNKGMGWVGTALTLHYLLIAGGSMLYFDWDYYACRSKERIISRQTAENAIAQSSSEVEMDLDTPNSPSSDAHLSTVSEDYSKASSSTGALARRQFLTSAPKPSIYRDLINVLMLHLSTGVIDAEDFAEEALLAAASRGDIEFLDALFSIGLDLSEGGDDALTSAASLGQIDSVNWLLKHMVDPTYDDSQALRAAISKGYNTIAQILAEHGADIRANDNEAIQVASARGYAACVSTCLSLGADVHVNGESPLRAALVHSHTETVKVLLQGGANAAIALSLSHEVWDVLSDHVKGQTGELNAKGKKKRAVTKKSVQTETDESVASSESRRDGQTESQQSQSHFIKIHSMKPA